MKRFWQIMFFVLVASMAVHILLWKYGRPLHEALREQTQAAPRSPRGGISEQRLKLEEQQREELRKYKWIDERKGYVQIPVDRAFDYYLESLP